MEHERVEGWDPPDEQPKTWCVLRAAGSGRLWGYPSHIGEWVLGRHPDKYEFVCTVDDYPTLIQMCRLANHELELEMKG